MFVIVELLYETQGKRKKKREWESISNIAQDLKVEDIRIVLKAVVKQGGR
jgi:hypothetical protein